MMTDSAIKRGKIFFITTKFCMLKIQGQVFRFSVFQHESLSCSASLISCSIVISWLLISLLDFMDCVDVLLYVFKCERELSMSSLVFKLSLFTNLMNVSPMSDRIHLNTAEL